MHWGMKGTFAIVKIRLLLEGNGVMTQKDCVGNTLCRILITFSLSSLPYATQYMNFHVLGTYGLKCFGFDSLADGPRDESGSRFVNQETM